MITRYGSTPTSQKDLPLMLVLLWPGGLWYHGFDPRPEDVSYGHASRAQVIQTLGGAYVDDFGEGLTDITIGGTTGWRATESLAAGLPLDGMARMFELRQGFFELFHGWRMNAAQAGLDPDVAVSMYLADTLNWYLFQVYPMQLQVRRHKARPLLYQFTMRMVGIKKLVDISDWVSAPPNLLGLF